MENSRDILFDKCVYTIVNINVIEQSQNNEDMSGSFIEKKSWKKAIDLGNQAAQEEKTFLLMLADAARIDGVLAIAIIDEIEILANGSTKVSFSGAHWLREIQPLSKLRLLSSGQFLSDRYIRPYALCFTPEFAFEDYDYLLSHSNDDEAETLVRENDVPNNGLDVNKVSTPSGSEKPEKTSSMTTQYVRDPLVKEWVLRTANGHCECCKQKAPFESEDDLPFLEVHHIRQLSEDGSDRVSNTVALCPNCHRELHYGKRRDDLVLNLYQTIDRLVAENK